MSIFATAGLTILVRKPWLESASRVKRVRMTAAFDGGQQSRKRALFLKHESDSSTTPIRPQKQVKQESCSNCDMERGSRLSNGANLQCEKIEDIKSAQMAQMISPSDYIEGHVTRARTVRLWRTSLGAAAQIVKTGAIPLKTGPTLVRTGPTHKHVRPAVRMSPPTTLQEIKTECTKVDRPIGEGVRIKTRRGRVRAIVKVEEIYTADSCQADRVGGVATSLAGDVVAVVGGQLLREGEVGDGWRRLGVGPEELNLALTLPTGQTFRWQLGEEETWTGVIGTKIVSLRQTPEEIFYRIHRPVSLLLPPGSRKPRSERRSSGRKGKGGGPHDLSAIDSCGSGAESADHDADVEMLRCFFNLDSDIEAMWLHFSLSDTRFASLAPYVRGVRILKQDPLECLLSFICSSNNHIARITSLVRQLAGCGTLLGEVEGVSWHAFPNLQQLSHLTEPSLRGWGFGYRAKYIAATVALLNQKAGGGKAYLATLQALPLANAISALEELPGVGPKVAACVALFSLNHLNAIPVDTHVWQLAVRYYTPELEGRSLTPKLMAQVAQVFHQRFGLKAGWALNAMFVAELPAIWRKLPLEIQPVPRIRVKKKKKAVGEIEMSTKEVLAIEAPPQK